MIFNTLIKGGITGKPIEVTELPTPTASDVDKIYLLKNEETTYLSPQVGQPFGNKIYFNTELNPLDYTSSFLVEAGTDLLRTETTDEYYSLAFVDILALQGVEGYGHAYIIGVANGALSTVIGIAYIYCDVLSVEQFNAMVGSQFGISITEFGWLASEIDTSSIADRIVHTNILPAYDNIAYTSTESTFKEEYYKCVEVKDTIEVGKTVPEILYFDTSKTPEFDRSASTTEVGYLLTQDQYFAVASVYMSGEDNEDLDGSLELLMLQFSKQIPVILYVDGTASLEVINNLIGAAGEITQKGWQIDGTLNIPEKGLEVATNLGLTQAEFEQALALAFADPVVTFTDPQGLFIFPTTYAFEPFGESGFPIEVEELPTPTEDDIGKVYLKTTTDEYYKAGFAPLVQGEPVGDAIIYDVNSEPMPIGTVPLAQKTILKIGETREIIEMNLGVPIYLFNDGTTLSTLYVPAGASLEDVNGLLEDWGATTVTKSGWQGDGKIDTSAFATELITSVESQNVFFGNGFAPALCNNNLVEQSQKDFVSLVQGTLTNLTIPQVTYIKDGVFASLPYITSVDIPDSVEMIGDRAFSHCQGLKTVTVGKSLRYISNFAFEQCVDLAEISLSNIEVFGERAFEGCFDLENINLGENVTQINKEAFFNTAFYLNDSNWVNNVLYINNYLIVSKSSLSGNYVVGEGTKLIACCAFEERSGLTSITIPNSIKSINNYAFRNCGALLNVTIKATSPPTISSGVFYNCPSTMAIFAPLASIDAYKSYFNSDAELRARSVYLYPYIETEAELSSIDTSLYTKANVNRTVYNYVDGAWTAEE